MTLIQAFVLPLALLATALDGGGFLGVKLEDGTPTVAEVIPDTAAAKSDVRVGDRFVAVNGRSTPDTDTFIEAVGSHSPGDRVRFDLYRGEREITLYVVLGKRPSDEPAPMAEEPEEIEEVEAPEPLRERARVAPRSGRAFLGVQITPELEIQSLVEGGPAEQAGLETGDRILRLGRAGDLDSHEDLAEALSELRPGQTIRVKVRRDGESETVALTLGAHPDEGGTAVMVREVEEPASKPMKEPKASKQPKEPKAMGFVRAKEHDDDDDDDDEHEHEHGDDDEHGEHSRSKEIENLRKELKQLREDIRELKELVKKLGR